MNRSEYCKLLESHPDLFEMSLLSLLFDSSTPDIFIESMVVQDYTQGQVIFREGEVSKGIYIVIEGIVDLRNDYLEEQYSLGTVSPYRSLSTYSAIRGEAFTCSAEFRTAGKLLLLSNELIEQLVRQNPDVFTYLKVVTENSDCRSLAKSLDQIGCSKVFKSRFFATIEEKHYLPHTVISTPNSQPEESVFFVDGQAIFERKGALNSDVKQWQAPLKTWLLWSALIESTPTTLFLRTTAKAKAFCISRVSMEDLKKNFPADFKRFSSFVLNGAQEYISENNAAIEVELDSLFKGTLSPVLPSWKRYPWIMQSDAMDCGPACMAMISKSYGRSVTLQYWRSQLSTGREGTSVFDLAQTAEKNGFITAAIRVEDISELDRTYLPCIALRQNHYVVVYEIKGHGVVIGDPELGVRKESFEDFEYGFQNTVLLLKPTNAFERLPEEKFQFRPYLSLLSDLKKELLISFLVSIAMILVGLSGPIMTQIFLDDILVRRDLDLMWIVFAAGLFVAVTDSALSWVKVYYSTYISTKVEYKLSAALLKRVLNLPFKTHSEKHVGDFTTRFSDLDTIKSFILETSESVLLAALNIVIYGIVLFAYAPQVALAALASLPIFALISWASGKHLVQIDQDIFKASAEKETSLTDTIKGVSVIKSLGAQLAARWRFEERMVKVLKLERKYELREQTIGAVFHVYLTLVKYGVTGLCMYLAITGDLSAGQVIATTMIAFSLFGPLLELTDQVGEFQQIIAVVNRTNDVLLEPGEEEGRSGKIRPDDFKGEIEFRDVWFKYGAESADWVLRGLNFKIEAGQKVSIVGPSGSGKSTVAALMNRMLLPTQGYIFIDGRNYLDYDLEWLREKIGILQQETSLFSGTLMENIALGEPEFDFDDVLEAAQDANAHDFILSKPNGYSYVLSSSGMGLSGGEKQRVALARTLYRCPKVLILDEATSALDGIAESQLMESIHASSEDMTVLSIAHRFSTAICCDVALVMANGHVVGMGTHQELAASNSTYKALFADYLYHPKIVSSGRSAA